MNAAILQSLAVASGGLLSIGSILIVLVLLSARGGAVKAGAYAAGFTAGYLGIGAGLLVLGDHLAAKGAAPAAEPSAAGPVTAMVLGALLLTFGLRRWRTPAEDPRPPRLFAHLDRLTTQRALGFGLLVTVINLKNLAIFGSAVAILAEARLPLATALAANVANTLLFSASVTLPVLAAALLGERADPWLSAFRALLERRSRPLSIGVMLLFGSVFLLRGLIALV